MQDLVHLSLLGSTDYGKSKEILSIEKKTGFFDFIKHFPLINNVERVRLKVK